MFIFFFFIILLDNLGAHGQELYINLFNNLYSQSNNPFAQGESSTAASIQLPHDQYRPPGNNE